jgi:hypothetical protein
MRRLLLYISVSSEKILNFCIGSKRQKLDACVIRTHAPEGNALAGHRVNHSAKAP